MVLNSDSSSDGWGGTHEKIFGPKPQEVKLNLVPDTEKNDPLRAIKIEMHSILVSEQTPINGQEVLYKYCDMFGFDLDPQEYNCTDIDDLLQAMPDKIQVFESDGIYTYRAKPDDRVADIQSLVRRQITKEQAMAKKYNRRNTWKNSQNRTNRANIYNSQQYQNDPYSRIAQPATNNDQYLKSQVFTIPTSTRPIQTEVSPKTLEMPSCPTQGNRWDTPNEEDARKAFNVSVGTKLNNMLKPKPPPTINNWMIPQHSAANTSQPAISLSPLASASLVTSVSKVSTKTDEQIKNSNCSFGNTTASKQPHIVKAIIKRISFDDEPKSKSCIGRHDVIDENLKQRSFVEQPEPEPLSSCNSTVISELDFDDPALTFQTEDEVSNVQVLVHEANAQNASEEDAITMAGGGSHTLPIKKSYAQMTIEESNVQMVATESNVQETDLAANIPVAAQDANNLETADNVTTSHSVNNEIMSSNLLQLLALEATHLLGDSDQKSALLHMLVEMVHLFRTFQPNKPDEQQELQYLIEDLLCAL